MRTELAKKYNERERFSGIFQNFGIKRGYRHKETTVILSQIKDSKGNILTDHLWFNYTKEFKKLWHSGKLQTGKIIEFNARVKIYTKGYEKDEFDYNLQYPRKLKIIGEDPIISQESQCDPPYEYVKTYFNYTYPYNKLEKEEYTTVRGLNSLEYHKLNQVIDAQLNYKFHHKANIIKIERKKISQLTLKFLKEDCEYEGFEISSKKEFIDLLNSFRKSEKSKVKFENDPEFAIFTFRKLPISKNEVIGEIKTKKKSFLALDAWIL